MTLPKDAKGYALLGIGAVVLVYVIYHAARGAVSAAAGAAGGIVTGNNALTAGTPYAGAGIAGTLGAATNDASGGLLAQFGTWLGGKIADITQPYNPNAGSTPVPAGSTAGAGGPSQQPANASNGGMTAGSSADVLGGVDFGTSGGW